jgi:hypothetical protein
VASWKTANVKDPVFKTKSQTYKAEAIEVDSNGPFQNIQACQLFGNLTIKYNTLIFASRYGEKMEVNSRNRKEKQRK